MFKTRFGTCVVPNFAVSKLDSNVMQFHYLSYCGQRYWFSFVVCFLLIKKWACEVFDGCLVCCFTVILITVWGVCRFSSSFIPLI